MISHEWFDGLDELVLLLFTPDWYVEISVSEESGAGMSCLRILEIALA